jgi:predicted transcriptional regulator
MHLSVSPKKTATAGTRRSSSAYGRAALTGQLERVEIAPRSTRTTTLFAASCRLGELGAGHEVHLEQARSALMEMGRVIGLADADVRRTVNRGLARGSRNPRSAPSDGRMISTASEAVAEVSAWWTAVQADEWRGARACTTQRVLASIALLSVGAGKLRIDESYRELAEASGVAVSTIHAHLDAIAPWVRRVQRGSRYTGSRSTWQLIRRRPAADRPAVGSRPLRPPSAPLPTRGSLTDPAHSCWHRWSSGWRLFSVLNAADGPQTVAQLASATGLCRGSVRRNLRRFAGHGIAQRLDDWSWGTVPDAAIDDGLIDHQAARRARHEAQRACWRCWRSRVLAEHERSRSRRTDGGSDPNGARKGDGGWRRKIGNDQVLRERVTR